MKTFQCLILTQDVNLATLLKVTLKEYGFRFKAVPSIDFLGRMSTGSITAAWFIDLDGIQTSIEEIVGLARNYALEAKIVFLCSGFTRGIAETCLKEGAISLLVKPIAISKLVQTVNSLLLEPELLERDDLIPLKPESPTPTPVVREVNFLLRPEFNCPVCNLAFSSNKFKHEMFQVSKTDTDFCPIGPPNLIPELYAIVVCPSCLFGHYSSRFDRLKLNEEKRLKFLKPRSFEDRKKIAINLSFDGKRNLTQGTRSYDLGIHSAYQFYLQEADRLAGEYSLKASWLCRKMNEPLQEQIAQTTAVDKFLKVYNPYLSENGKFPSKEKLAERLGKEYQPLSERGIIVAGFLAAELSRRLGLLEQADFYFQEIMRIPFLNNFSTLLRHVHGVRKLIYGLTKPD